MSQFPHPHANAVDPCRTTTTTYPVGAGCGIETRERAVAFLPTAGRTELTQFYYPPIVGQLIVVRMRMVGRLFFFSFMKCDPCLFSPGLVYLSPQTDQRVIGDYVCYWLFDCIFVTLLHESTAYRPRMAIQSISSQGLVTDCLWCCCVGFLIW